MGRAVLLLGLVLAASCNPGGTDQQEVAGKDAAATVDTVIINKPIPVPATRDTLPAGIYQGVFPCKDCDGIQQTILFNNDRTYREEQMTWNGNELPRVSTGTWTLREGMIRLTQNNRAAIDFVKKGDTLMAIDIDGIALSNSSRYELIKRVLAGSNPVWEKKMQEGVDFAGIGHDPLWNLDIRYGKSLSFRLGDGTTSVTAAYVKPVVTRDSTVYRMKGDTVAWRVVLFPLFCTDGVSSNLYPFRVRVQYKGVLYKGCGVQLSKKNSL